MQHQLVVELRGLYTEKLSIFGFEVGYKQSRGLEAVEDFDHSSNESTSTASRDLKVYLKTIVPKNSQTIL